MLITREIDYAVRTVRALSTGEKLNIRQICDRENIPIEFGYKILKKLSNQNIVYVIRGAFGGYRLNVELEDLTLYDILSATGENLLMNECLRPDYRCINNSNGNICSINKEILRIQNVLMQELRVNSMKSILGKDLEMSLKKL